MHAYVEAATRRPTARKLEEVLDLVVPRPALHARFVNTLARMEYIGVRKMLKSRRADRLDLDGLEHALDETVHALRLKKAALALASAAPGQVDVGAVRTFADGDTLAGDAGEAYFQALDRGAEAALAARAARAGQAGIGAGTGTGAGAGAPDDARAEANYLLTSAAIEVRAQVFYPLYESKLRAHGAPFSVAAIIKDEGQHLDEMAARLARTLADWRQLLEPILAAEEDLFGRFLGAVESASRAA